MNEENIKSDDYISLPPFKKFTIQFLRSIFSLVDLAFEVIRKSRLLLLTGLITGLVVGFSYYNSRPAYYEVSMIAESSSAYRKTISEMIQSLNDLLGSQSQSKLATEMGINEQQVSHIRLIEVKGLYNESLENDTSTKYNQPFKIVSRITDPQLTDTFQAAIVRYLNNKPLLKKIKEDQVKFYNEKLVFLDNQLAKLDTLKTEYIRFLSNSKITTTYYSNDVDPSNAYKQSNELIDEKGRVINWISSNSKPIQVIDEFKTPSQPKSYNLFKSLLYGAVIGFLICFLLGLYIELYRKTRIYQ